MWSTLEIIIFIGTTSQIRISIFMQPHVVKTLLAWNRHYARNFIVTLLQYVASLLRHTLSYKTRQLPVGTQNSCKVSTGSLNDRAKKSRISTKIEIPRLYNPARFKKMFRKSHRCKLPLHCTIFWTKLYHYNTYNFYCHRHYVFHCHIMFRRRKQSLIYTVATLQICSVICLRVNGFVSLGTS